LAHLNIIAGKKLAHRGVELLRRFFVGQVTGAFNHH
jgi:hypothetical protein